jgi:hypothetical protein
MVFWPFSRGRNSTVLINAIGNSFNETSMKCSFKNLDQNIDQKLRLQKSTNPQELALN